MGSSRKASSRHRQKPDPVAQRVGARIRHLRDVMGFTFDAFVGETELGRGYVSELERGLVVPTVAVVDRVAAALGVTMADLVAGESLREQIFSASLGLAGPQLRPLLRQVQQTSEEARCDDVEG